MRDALLVIDMQQEFLSPEGMFSPPIPAAPLLAPILRLIRAARGAEVPVVWVQSAYPLRATAPAPAWPARPEGARYRDVPMNTKRLASGHAGRPCCVPGSPLCDLIPDLAAEVREGEDARVWKERYSAFTGTTLEAELRARGVERVILAGVTGNVCVRATAADAFFLGFQVAVVQDAVGATSARLQREGVEAIGRWYGEVAGSPALLAAWGYAEEGLGAGDSAILYGGILPEDVARGALGLVREEVCWQEMRHRGGTVPRQVAVQGRLAPDGAEPIYRHPADEQPPLVPFTPAVERLRRLVEARIGQPLNHALIQRYLGGESFIRAHADKTLDVVRGSAVVNLSLGATRTMTLAPKHPDQGLAVQRVELPHGSLFRLGWETNRAWLHAIRPDRRADPEKRPDELRDGGERISLTFRHIGTFQQPDGRLRGQGARRPSAPPLDPLAQAEQMLLAFRAENRDPAFRWEDHYADGFDTRNFHLLQEPSAEEGEGQ